MFKAVRNLDLLGRSTQEQTIKNLQKLLVAVLFITGRTKKEFIIEDRSWIEICGVSNGCKKVLFSMGRLKKRCMYVKPLRFEDPYYPDKVYKVKRHCMDYNQLLELFNDDIIFGSTKKELCNAFEKSQDCKHTKENQSLAKDEEGEEVNVHMKITRKVVRLKMEKLLEGELSQILPKTTTWNEFSSTMASAIICLAHNPKFTFAKFIFEDEAIHKELGDSLVSAATTASSLEAEQDSGGGPRCQETMGDTIARGLRVYLNIPMIHYWQETKTTQQNEIDSLKRRVKKLEKKKSSKTQKLKRLYKVGLIARVESSGDEEDLDDADNEMFDVNALNGEEVFVAGQNENVVEEIVDVAQVSTAATTVTITIKEITLAQVLDALKTSKPKVQGIVFQEPGKSTTTTTISSQQSHDKGKGIMIEEHVKPMKKKDQISFDEEVALKLQADFDEEERLAREKAEQEANIALIET
ncbi:hypothetical protein Tco_1152996 [Tanacetum coccineum]